MTDQCQHGVTARNCHTCFMESEHQKICKRESCWCRLYSANVRGVFMSDLYEAIQPLRERIEALEERAQISFVVINTEFRERLDKIEKVFGPVLQKGETLCVESPQETHKRLKKGVPFKCPVCLGWGSPWVTRETADGPREHYVKTKPCVPCKGAGVVWA